MPVYDFECTNCGRVSEKILSIAQLEMGGFECGECQSPMKQILLPGGTNCANEDADWIRSTLEVVDKEGGIAARRFVQDPTRENRKKWMKETGVRQFEPGEKPQKPDSVDVDKMTDHVMRKRQERNTLNIR
jgi:putative FmdB family regulatory protein